jgi:hypothetical protein
MRLRTYDVTETRAPSDSTPPGPSTWSAIVLSLTALFVALAVPLAVWG